MKREDIDRTLRSLSMLVTCTDAGIDTRAIGALANIVADQERRLRALEPCPERRIAALPPSDPHRWIEDGPETYTCQFCGVPR